MSWMIEDESLGNRPCTVLLPTVADVHAMSPYKRMDAKSRQADSGKVKLHTEDGLASLEPCVSIKNLFEIQSGIDACINAKLFGTKLLDILVI